MDTQHLTTFVTVAETGSFSDAAIKLHLTQPAISKRIALLEQQLAKKLFDRFGKNIHLTPAGRLLLPHARQILQSVTDAGRALADLDGDISGPLSIATSHHIGLHRLPAVLSEFSRAFPLVHLDLHFLDSEKALLAVEQGEFELGVITLGEYASAHIAEIPVWQDTLEFVCAANHPLALRTQIQLSDLCNYQAIAPDSNTHTTRLMQKLFDRQDLTLDVSMVTNHLDTIKMMVSIGLGWGVLPRSMIDTKLTILDLKTPPLTRELGAVFHTKRSQSNAARKFLNVLQNASQAE
ncbi:LysR family transcriptional regulator [Gilvimarinus polysaccharolyticus]|uniref:LysR family transcriptional regulator n=1 Tax=Gilvimarinus polysaccharolyticus TaxID=863921 RepID=UPI0006737F29|nr:LysR family transcriptional regulator [Gilvimarinus polysaccharolyticus]